ncbi:MAG: hypothetical protein P9L90_00730 [Candidatus Aadella gelida]|nr:hypothetical protein [Candidatus Aadella gelida]
MSKLDISLLHDILQTDFALTLKKVRVLLLFDMRIAVSTAGAVPNQAKKGGRK